MFRTIYTSGFPACASLVVAGLSVCELRAAMPTAPSNLTATAITGAGMGLNWTASSDDLGVTGYLVERCSGAGCTGFVQVASLPATGMSGPLTVSPNPRYFADAAGNTLLLGGSHHWLNLVDSGTVSPPPAFDYDAWLNFLATNHHNFFRLWAQDLPKKNYTIQDAGPWFQSPHPWVRTGPGTATDGLPKFDLSLFNPVYFDRLRERVIKANARGMYVAIMLFDGYQVQFNRRADDGFPLTGSNNINGVNDGGGTASQNLSVVPANVLAAQDAYVRKVVDTVNDLPNVLYEISNESGSYSTGWQQHMIALIKSYEVTKLFQHPVGFTFQYSGGTDAALYASSADWVSPEERLPANNGTRHVINNDTDHSYYWTFMKSEGPQLNRAFVWKNCAAGNSAMFMDPYLMPWTSSGNLRNAPTGCGAGPSCTNVDPSWNSIRKNIGYMLDLANRLPLATMTPQPALASTTHCLARAATNGAAYLVFAPSGGSFTVNLSATTNLLKVAWLNPSTGATTNVPSVNGGSSARSFTTPFSGDAVLQLVDATVPPGPTNVAYHDAGLAAGMDYSYRVRAVDGDGNLSGYSAIVSASKPGLPPVVAPAWPLKPSANGRYLVDSNGVPCLLMGDSPQALFVKLTDAEADAFLADRAARGFNSVWVNLLCRTNNGGLPNGQTVYGILPFTNTIAGTSNYDLTTPNEAYFAHVDNVLNLAAQHGLQVMLGPLETSGGGWTATARANGTNRCRAYGQYLGNRYQNFDNLIWWSGNDFQDWMDTDSDAVVRAIAEGIQSADTRHQHTLMLDYPVSGSLDNPAWAPILGLNASYTYWPTYAQVLADYNRTNFIPTFMAEAHYEFEGLYEAEGSPEVLRRQAYWSLLSGACGQFYGNHFTWQFIAGWQTNLNTTGSVQMANVKSLFASRRWHELVPDQDHTVVTAGYGTFSSSGSLTNNNYATAARTPDGLLVLVYLPTSRTITVDMTQLNAPPMAQWFDPSSGGFTNIAGSPFANSGPQTFTPPASNADGDGDWVLVLEAPDSVPPMITTALSAKAVGLNRVNLTWSNSTDNVGVTGYRLERCAGAGCDTFTEVAAVASNSFADVGRPAGTVFRYRVRAVDAATNFSGYSSIATATTWTMPPSWSGLVADYAFDEGAGTTTSDASGNGNTGWLGSAAWTTQGKFSGALSFNGSSLVTVSNSSSLNLSNAMTLEAWIFTTNAAGAPATLVMKETAGGFAYRLQTDASNRPAVFINTSGGVQGATGPAPLPLNTWTHVAGTFDGAALRVCVNGTLVASNSATGDILPSAAPLRIGGNSIAGEYFFGKIDGVRIYNRPLSPAEVQADMNHASGASPVFRLSALPQSFDEVVANGFRLYLTSDTAATYAIEASVNLTAWQTISIVQYTNGLLPLTDFSSALPGRSFYRAQSAGGAPVISLNAPAQTVGEIATNGFRLFVTATAPAPLVIERTTDFISWQPVGAFLYTNGPVEFNDALIRLAPVRLYRARLL